jgi:hypothetical protein
MALRKALKNTVTNQLEGALAAFSTDDVTISKDALRKVFLSVFDTAFDTAVNLCLTDITDADLKRKIYTGLYAETTSQNDIQ